MLSELTFWLTAGWQRWIGTPKTPVTAGGDVVEVPDWSVDDSVDPEPWRLKGFTLSFHVAACAPTPAVGTLSRDDWLGGEAPELGVLCSFCFGEPTGSVEHFTQSHTHSASTDTNVSQLFVVVFISFAFYCIQQSGMVAHSVRHQTKMPWVIFVAYYCIVTMGK